MLAQGLATYETDKWAKHKRLISPAFQLHKVKVHFLISSFAWLIFKTVISIKKKMTIEHFDTYSICFQYSMRVVLKCWANGIISCQVKKVRHRSNWMCGLISRRWRVTQSHVPRLAVAMNKEGRYSNFKENKSPLWWRHFEPFSSPGGGEWAAN